MSPEQSRALFLDHCQPGDRGTLERYGEKAAVAAIVAVTAHIEAEARRYAGFYKPHSDGRNTFVIFADAVSDLQAERFAL
jgi:hypothetical protein